jgi:hypothetical protein
LVLRIHRCHPLPKESPDVPLPSYRQLLLYGTCTTLLAGCTLATPTTNTPTPERARVDSTQAPKDKSGSRPRRPVGTWRYKLESRARVSLPGNPTGDTQVGRTTLYTITLAQDARSSGSNGAFNLTGTVDSVAVSTGDGIPQPSIGTNAPPHFSAELSAAGQLTNLRSDAITSCQHGIDPLTATLQALIVPLPATISIGTSWRDTVSTITCRGRVPISTTAIRHYRILGDTSWQAQPALRIYRVDSLTIESRPDPGSAELTVRGSGNGAATLYVATGTGLLITARSNGSTQLTVATGQSVLPFRQDASETITLIR